MKTLATFASLALATSAHAAVIVIDNEDAAYASTGFTSQNGTNIFDGTHQFNSSANNSGFATWTFTGLTNGVYDVYATWNQGNQANLSTAAPFSGTDGFISMTVNQEVKPDNDLQIDDTDGGGTLTFDFVKLGTVTVSDTNFQVRLDAVAGGGSSDFVLADAVAINPVPEPSSAALLGLGGLALMLRRRK